MKLVWHIVRKDWRRQWPWLALWWALLAFKAAFPTLAFAWAAQSVWQNIDGFEFYYYIILSLDAIFLTVNVVEVIHADAPAGDRAFWRTRPISPLGLVAAKGIFIGLFCLLLPAFILAAARWNFGFTGELILATVAWSSGWQAAWIVAALLIAVLWKKPINGLLTVIGVGLVGYLAFLWYDAANQYALTRLGLAMLSPNLDVPFSWLMIGGLMATDAALIGGLVFRPKRYLAVAGLILALWLCLGTGTIFIDHRLIWGTSALSATRSELAIGVGLSAGVMVASVVYLRHNRALGALTLGLGLVNALVVLLYWPLVINPFVRVNPRVEHLPTPVVSDESFLSQSDGVQRLKVLLEIADPSWPGRPWPDDTGWRPEWVDSTSEGPFDRDRFLADTEQPLGLDRIQLPVIKARRVMERLGSAPLVGAFQELPPDTGRIPVAFSEFIVREISGAPAAKHGWVVFSHGPLREIARVPTLPGALSSRPGCLFGLAVLKYDLVANTNLELRTIRLEPTRREQPLVGWWRQPVEIYLLVNAARNEALACLLSQPDEESGHDGWDLNQTRRTLRFGLTAKTGEQSRLADPAEANAWLAGAELIFVRYEPEGLAASPFTVDLAHLNREISPP